MALYSNSGKRHHHHHHHSSFLTTGTTAPKSSNRYLAALDFLLNIPMEKEQSIVQAGSSNYNRIQNLERKINEDGDEIGGQSTAIQGDIQNIDSGISHTQNDYTFGFKKLPGIPYFASPIPLLARYPERSEESAIMKKWEDGLIGRGSINDNQSIQQSVLSSRVFFSSTRAYPMTIFSVISFDKEVEHKKLQLLKSEQQKADVFKLPQRDWRGFSYRPVFKSTADNDMMKTAGNNKDAFSIDMYDPDCLDDPNMIFGSHHNQRTPSQFTGPILSSIIPYATKKQVKESLNDRFRELHPHLPASLTLSKIRRIKRDVVNMTLELNLELSTAAYAIIYFEILCLKGFVTKFNRWLAMSVCLLLATKFNENIILHDTNKKVATRDRVVLLLDYFDREWELSKSEIFSAEFGAFVHLKFSLHVPHRHLHVVYSRLLKMIHKSGREYLSEDMDDVYAKYIMEFEDERNQNQEGDWYAAANDVEDNDECLDDAHNTLIQ